MTAQDFANRYMDAERQLESSVRISGKGKIQHLMAHLNDVELMRAYEYAGRYLCTI